MQKTFFALGLSILLLIVGASSFADTSLLPFAKEDNRLDTKVTIKAVRVSLYDLLQSIAGQSGINLAFDSKSSASGITVVIYIEHQPTHKVLSAIASLISTRQFSASWTRQQNLDKTYSYHLVAPRLDEIAAQCRKAAIQAFTEQAKNLRQVALDPSSAKKFDSDPVMSLMANDKSVVGGVKLLMDALPGEEWKQILEPQTKIFVPINLLSPASRQFILDETPENSRHLLRDQIFIHTDAFPNVLPPILFIEFGAGGQAYVGGVPLNEAMNAKVLADWKQKSDQETASDKSALVATESSDPFLTKEMVYSKLELSLFHIGQRFSIPIIAITPQDDEEVASPHKSTLAACLTSAHQNRWSFGAKWNSDILLFIYPAWFKTADEIAPFDVVRRIQAFGDLPVIQRSLVEMSKVVSSIGEKEWRKLVAEDEYVRRLAGMRQALLLVKPYFEITKTQGAAITPEIRQFLRKDFGQIVDIPICERVRLRYIIRKTKTAVEKLLMCEFMNSDGKPIGGRGATLSTTQLELSK